MSLETSALPESTQSYVRFLRSATRPRNVEIAGLTFRIDPGVFYPGPVAEWFLEKMPLREGDTLCEIGTGHAAVAVLAHLRRTRAPVVATDVSKAALQCARANAAAHGCRDHIDLRCGEVFDPIEDDERFDVLFWYAPIHSVAPADTIERAVTDERRQGLGRYLREGRDHLRDGGRLCLGYAQEGDVALVRSTLDAAGFDHFYEHWYDRPGAERILFVARR